MPNEIVALFVVDSNRDSTLLLDWGYERVPYHKSGSVTPFFETELAFKSHWEAMSQLSEEAPVLVEVNSVVHIYSLRVACREGIIDPDQVTIAWVDPVIEHGDAILTCGLDRHSKFTGEHRPPNIFDKYLDILL